MHFFRIFPIPGKNGDLFSKLLKRETFIDESSRNFDAKVSRHGKIGSSVRERKISNTKKKKSYLVKRSL